MTSAIVPSERTLKTDLIINDYSWYGKLIKNTWKNEIIHYSEDMEKNNESLANITDSIFENLTNELGESVKDANPYNSISFKLIQDTKKDYYKGIKILLDDGYYSLLEDKGSGIKSLVIIELFKLYCKKYHKSSSCLIVEEPEIFLHPQARSVLSKKIDQFNDTNGNQTIITTHSEQFISNFDITQLIFVDKENNESKSYKINENDFSSKELEKMNIIATSENAEMFFANYVILVEGGEKFILRKLIDLLYSPLLLDYKNVSLISVKGKSFFETYKAMLEKLNKKVYILGDYDNLKEGLTQFVKDNANTLNQIKGYYGKLPDYDSLEAEYTSKIDLIFKELENQKIFVLHNGQLEDYYIDGKVNELKSQEKLSGKEIVAHYIASILNKDNINDYLQIDNDFKDYINQIISDILNKGK